MNGISIMARIIKGMLTLIVALSVPGFNQAPPLTAVCKKDGAAMIRIPSGDFLYGIRKKTRDSLLAVLKNASLPIFDKEFPLITKFLPSYYIDKTEITNSQYAIFMKQTNHRAPAYWSISLFNQPQQPVIGVGWDDAKAYAAWAGKRLPTEEEWEKAARGTDGRLWPWGNNPSGKFYNGITRANNKPVDAGSFPEGASPYGVLDMAGNVYEMTTGRWSETSYAMRGGCYLNAGAYTRTMFRWSADDERNGASWLGFRCVADTSALGDALQGASNLTR